VLRCVAGRSPAAWGWIASGCCGRPRRQGWAAASPKCKFLSPHRNNLLMARARVGLSRSGRRQSRAALVDLEAA